MKADQTKLTNLLKTAKGQIEGILKMVEEDRYCMDISNQILATESILHKANQEVLRGHMEFCVKAAFRQGNEKEKISEILELLDKMI